MKKCKVFLLAVQIIVMLFAFTVFAGAKGDSLYSESIENLREALDSETVDVLEALGLDEFSAEEISNISLKNVFNSLFGMFTGGLKEPLACLASVMGLLILITLSESYIGNNGDFKDFIEAVCSLFISLLVFSKVIGCISDCVSVLGGVSVITKILIPVMAAVTAFSGSPSMAVGYNAVTLYAAEIISALCVDFLTPVLCIFSALSVCGAVNSSFKINPLLNLIKKLFSMVLGLIGTVFTGVIAVKDILAAGIDRVSVKGVKFILGSTVPVVGGALSDGLSSVIAAASLMKSAYGVLGIIIICVMTLPVISKLLIWLAALSAASYAAEAFSQTKTADVLSSLKFVFSMLLSLVLFAVFILIISTAMVILMSNK